LEHVPHLLNRKYNAVIGYELVDFPSPLEKMLMAFFGYIFLSSPLGVVSSTWLLPLLQAYISVCHGPENFLSAYLKTQYDSDRLVLL
jgi:hypothetical protein